MDLILRESAHVDVKNKKGNSPLWLAANGTCTCSELMIHVHVHVQMYMYMYMNIVFSLTVV